MKLISTSVYTKKAKKLFSAEEQQLVEQEIALAADKWPVVSGTGGIRKARVALGGRGKSGGARILYFLQLNQDTVFFMDVYAKGDKENISEADKKILKALVKEIVGG